MSMHRNSGIRMQSALGAACAIAALGASAAFAGAVPVVTEAQKLIASDGMPSDKFGIALDRQGDTLIIGAPQHYTNSMPGSFYIFTRDQAGLWNEQERVMSDFKAGSAEFGDLFGEELALEGDTLLVGAPFTELNGTMLVGLVYVFTRDQAGAWSQQQTLLPNDLNITRFGEHIALAPQGDRAVITGGSRAFVFARGGSGVWSQQAELLGSGFDSLGPVAFDGQTIVVANGGIPGSALRARVFTNDGSGWTPSASIATASAGVMSMVRDVCISGDEVALGIPDAAGEDLAYVFQQAPAPPGAWTEQAMLNPNRLDNDSFGSDVALNGDVLLVGANHAGANGITYVFTRGAAGTWSQQLQLMSSDNFPDNFGDEIDFEDNIPVIGSWAHHENGLYAGAVYVFDEILTPVIGDITGDGTVNVDDLVAVILAWGPCPQPPTPGGCPADIAPQGAPNGVVVVDDLIMVILNWG